MKKLLIVLALFCAMPQVVWADWFTKGETLVYDVRLGALKAGRAELHYAVTPKQTYAITIRAWTDGMVHKMFAMRDRIVAEGQHAVKTPFYSTAYNTFMNESHYKARKQTLYDRKKGQVVYRNLREAPVQDNTLPLLDGTRDIVSAMYHLRRQVGEIKVGQTYSLPVFDVRKGYTMNVRITGREKVKNKLGEFMAYVAKVQFVGEEETTDNVTVWVSDDINRWPVRINRKMAVGSFTADLRAVGDAALEVSAPVELPRTGEIKIPN